MNIQKFTRFFKALDKSVSFDPADYSEEVNQYFWEYGVVQSHSDAYASAKSQTERNALFEKRRDNLLKGELRAVREGDPLSKEVTKLAQAKANEYFAAKNIKSKDIDADSWKKVMAQYRAFEPLIAQAKVNVEAMQSIPDLDITL